MSTTNLYDLAGKAIGKISLPKEYFDVKINQKLLVQAIRVYLANQRKARAKTKTRGEVNLTRAKWYRQKGTGRARHGARSAPLFVGGGVAHGPRGNQNYKLTLPKKMRKQALASALTSKLETKEIFVVDDLEKIKGRTKELVGLLNQFLAKKGQEEKFLLVLSKKSEGVWRAAGNIPGLTLRVAKSLHPYEILNGGKILMTPQTVEALKKW